MDSIVALRKETLLDALNSMASEMSTSQKVRRHLRDSGIPSAEEHDTASNLVSIGSRADWECNDVTITQKETAVADVLEIERQPSSFPNDLRPEDSPAQSELDQHALDDHAGPPRWKCGTCSKYLSSERELNRHAHQVHFARQLYQCDVCPKTYAYAKSLKEHKRFHTGEVAHNCPFCPAAFVRRSAMRLHVQAIHEVAKHRACGECGKKFAFKSTLLRHFRVHSGETPYACHLCPKRFARTDRLLDHLRAHDDEATHCEKKTALADQISKVQSEEPVYSEEPLHSEEQFYSEEPIILKDVRMA
ncbi:uncharacterized protein LOC144107197 [Amblyomma americanum]